MTELHDTSLLPVCTLEFCVIADTHNMLDPGDRPLEFESRRRQTARVATALERVAACRPAFVLHLGDLVQSFPGSDDFDRNVEAARAQLAAGGIDPLHVVAGNHDVGDKPDPTMPAPVVDAVSLARHEARFGSSWYSVEYALPGAAAPLVVVALNSQILNSGLAAEAAQRQWLEAELPARRRQGARLVVALHLPPFVSQPDEPGLGHYDNVAEPARSWLLDLLRRYPVELLLAGHVHWAFSHRLYGGAYWIAPSTSFTRPGFGHLFTSCAAPERGRDDEAKLGFLLCRVFPDRIDVHTVRLGPGAGPVAPAAHLLTPLSSPSGAGDLGSGNLGLGGLGVTLTHPLSWTAEVPLAWPAAVRERARNDYPLVACRELGLNAVRAPLADLVDGAQEEALAELRRRGVRLQALELWEGSASAARLHRWAGRADTVELQLPGALQPDGDCAAALGSLGHAGERTETALCPVLPGQTVPGKLHPRTRTGYAAAELAGLDEFLSGAGLRVTAAVCRVEAGLDPWDQVSELRRALPLSRIGRLDLLLGLPGVDAARDARWLAEALFAARQLPSPRLFAEPLIDLDRTMDIGLGLLDGLCNPRPAAAVARCVQAVLYGDDAPWEAAAPPAVDLWALASPATGRRALLWQGPAPEQTGEPVALPAAAGNWLTVGAAVYDLVAATSLVVADEGLATVSGRGPVLVMSTC